MGPASTLWRTAASGGGCGFFAGYIDGSNPAVVWLPSLERCPDQAQSHRYSVHLKDLDRLAGPLRGQARSHRGLCASLRRNWSTGRPPSRAGSLPQVLSTSERSRWAGRPSSRASPLPQGIVCIFEKLVGWQATIASRLAPTEEQRQIGVHKRSSPLIRPSVSSPAAFDLDPPAPSEG
jgi:hypothetical protein